MAYHSHPRRPASPTLAMLMTYTVVTTLLYPWLMASVR